MIQVKQWHRISRGPPAKRAAWVAGDTGLSTLTNFILTIVVARGLSASDFGAFAVGYAIYGFAVTIVQAISGQVLAVRYSGAAGPSHREAARLALGAVALVGVVVGLVLVISGVVTTGPLRGVLVVLGIFMPGLLAQETWRSVFITRGTPKQAFLNDFAWLALQALALTIVRALSIHDTSAYVMAWAAAASVAAILGGFQARFTPRLTGLRAWLSDHREVSVPGLAYNVTAAGALPLAMLGVAAVAGTTSVAALRGAIALLGPAAVVTTAAPTFAVPEIVRRELTPRAATTAAVRICTSMAAVVTVWALLVIALPTPIGVAMLGETWPVARSVLPAVALFTILVQFASGPIIVIRAWNWVSFTVWLGVVQAPLLIILATVGAGARGGVGAAWGLAAAVAVTAPMSWLLLRVALRRGRRNTTAAKDNTVAQGGSE